MLYIRTVPVTIAGAWPSGRSSGNVTAGNSHLQYRLNGAVIHPVSPEATLTLTLNLHFVFFRRFLFILYNSLTYPVTILMRRFFSICILFYLCIDLFNNINLHFQLPEETLDDEFKKPETLGYRLRNELSSQEVTR